MEEEKKQQVDSIVASEEQSVQTQTADDAIAAQGVPAENADKVYFAWDGVEYQKQDRGIKWFAIAIVISLAVLGYVIYTRDWFMVPAVFIVDFLFFLYQKRKPVTRHYQFTRLGLFVDDLFYPFDEMHSFWIVYNEKVKMLNLMFLKKYIPVFSVYLNDIDPLKIRNFLKDILPEQEKRGELFVDKLLRILKI